MPTIIEERPIQPEIGKPTPEFTDAFRAFRATQPAYKALIKRIVAGEDRRALYDAAGAVGVTERELGALVGAAAILRDKRRLKCAEEYHLIVKERADLEVKLAEAQARHGKAIDNNTRDAITLEVRELLNQRTAILTRWAEARTAAKALESAKALGLVE